MDLSHSGIAVGLQLLGGSGPPSEAKHLHGERMGGSHLAREHCGHFTPPPLSLIPSCSPNPS
jgi:hypothetical protein